MVKPDKARGVEDLLIRAAQSGQVNTTPLFASFLDLPPPLSFYFPFPLLSIFHLFTCTLPSLNLSPSPSASFPYLSPSSLPPVSLSSPSPLLLLPSPPLPSPSLFFSFLLFSSLFFSFLRSLTWRFRLLRR